jgi:phosphate uptake regulator
MTIWREWFRGGESGLDRVRTQLLDMLDIDRQTFDFATAALLAGSDVTTARRNASESDHKVNEAVQEVRRELVVHSSTRGDTFDVPALLLYMSIVKDIERIGDYAKNILDIAQAGGDLSTTGDDHAQLAEYGRRVSALIAEVRDIFESQKADDATRVLTHWGDVSREMDQLVNALITVDASAAHAVPRALYYRYLKRIVGHLMNILTALVMPLDKVDFFWGEDREADY